MRDIEHTEKTLTAAVQKTFGGVSNTGNGGVRYVTAVQVNNGAGFAYGRTLDAVVFDTWPSKGLAVHGFEIKCSKSDLRRELQQTAKFAEFEPFLDTFSIVAPKEIIDRDIIPKRWGIYVPNDNSTLRTVRKPLYLHESGEQRREFLARTFAAAFARALVQRSLSTEARDMALAEGFKNGEQSKAYELSQAAKLSEQVVEFEQASGVSIGTYAGNGTRIGEAVKFVLSGGLESKTRYSVDLRNLAQNLLGLANEMDRVAASMQIAPVQP